MTGRTPKEGVNPVAFPEEIGHFWQWFLQLNSKRQSGMAGPQPLSESEIYWFFVNRRIALEGWELDAIGALDGIVLSSPAEEP